MGHKFTFFLLFLFISLFTGCSSSNEKINKTVEIEKIPSYQVIQQPTPPQKRAKGSLFSNQGGSLISDRRNLQIGDIVFVEINEEPTVETKSTRETTRDADSQEYTGGSVTTLENTPSLIKTWAEKLNGILGISAAFPSLTRDFSAESSSTVEDKFQNQVSAVVAKVFQNGNYFIIGAKEVVINGQKQVLELSGVMNPNDIINQNIINAELLANLKIVYYKEGEDQEYLEKNWGQQLLETISPF